MKTYPLAHYLFNIKKPYLIVGLGNPGEKYLDTRHNIGFEMLDVVSSAYGIKVSKIKFKALIGQGKINGKDVILAKPQTFMNLSGESVSAIARYYQIPPERIIVIFDDAWLDIGKIRIRAKGSSGGHNGMGNIIYHLKSENFPRIRIGIGQPHHEIIDYVLGKLTKEEVALFIETAKQVPDIIKTILIKGIDAAMNCYN
ncbi:MAG: aminoacyl-tRNA hydrolase [Clostridiaceae bacterium]|jgi:PTH1 family peptidyl-tRNA hydrolase|nr:aminoacyl-tRNA hydrolase [Clostridiaceae bacterium]